MTQQNPNLEFIDYSQYSTFMSCPWKWYWRYVEQYAKRWGDRQRDDALATGTLVHAGLEEWYKTKTPIIPQEVVDEVNPTPECFAAARQMLLAYVQRYPGEPTEWDVRGLEQPLIKRLQVDLTTPAYMLAKLDGYFYVPELTVIESGSGVDGHQLVLSPGFWGFETKTKGLSIPRGTWIQKWIVNMQASFQCLCLQEFIKEPVQGVLVNVIEKPREYIPKRKCKGCAELLPLAAYLQASEGLSACPVCGTEQKLKPAEQKAAPQPEFFRTIAIRNQDQLQEAERQITQVFNHMHTMRTEGRQTMPPNTENCVDSKWNRECEYFNTDVYGSDITTDSSMQRTDATKYVELVKLVGG